MVINFVKIEIEINKYISVFMLIIYKLLNYTIIYLILI